MNYDIFNPNAYVSRCLYMQHFISHEYSVVSFLFWLRTWKGSLVQSKLLGQTGVIQVQKKKQGKQKNNFTIVSSSIPVTLLYFSFLMMYVTHNLKREENVASSSVIWGWNEHLDEIHWNAQGLWYNNEPTPARAGRQIGVDKKLSVSNKMWWFDFCFLFFMNRIKSWRTTSFMLSYV